MNNKFFLCDNPFVDDGTDYILSIGQNSLIEVKPLDDSLILTNNQVSDDLLNNLKPWHGRVITFESEFQDKEHYTLCITHLFTDIDQAAREALIAEAANWYLEVLNLEDDIDSEPQELTPYCDDLPDLFIEFDQVNNKYIATYLDKQKEFELEDDMWEYILHELELIIPEEGIINEY